MSPSISPAGASLSAAAIDLLEIGLCAVDGSGRVARWNRELASHGQSESSVLGRPLREVIAPACARTETLSAILDETERVLNGGAAREEPVAEIRFPGPVPARFEVLVLPGSGNSEEPAAFLLMKPACQAREVRHRFERVLDSTPDGIMVLDRSRRLVFVNKACGRLMGRDPEEVVKSNCVCGDLVDCHTETGQSMKTNFCPARDLFAGGQTTQVEQMLATNSEGRERWIETSYSPIVGRDGSVDFVVGVVRDIHERKMLEERLQQTEKLASLGALTAGIAHEIKNPLGILLSSVEIIMDESRPREMQREAAQFIREEVQRLDERMRSFLQFARPKPPMPENVVVNGLIRRCLQALRPSMPRVEIEEQLAVPEPIVRVDPDQFRQVLTNLLLNAAEAIGNEGRLLVRTRTDDRGVVVEVHDSGPGIGEEHLKQIFDPFFTTKAHGTGLGLSVVYQIINDAGGRISASRSRELDGAVFRIELPCRSPLKTED